MYSLKEYYNFTKEIYESRGINGILYESIDYMHESFIRTFINPIIKNKQEYVLDKEWDVLIILDACRVDLLEEVAEDYDFIETPPHNTMWSAGSYSEGWLKNNFTGEKYNDYKSDMENMIYVSGNPFTGDVLDDKKFQKLDNVWKYGWNTDDGYMPPDIITDKSISYYRNENPDRMIIHYMQPHIPFITESKSGYTVNTDIGYRIDKNKFASPRKLNEKSPWKLYADSEIQHDEIWGAYKSTLHFVLQSVEKLLKNIDAEKVIISADHGESLGKFGIYGHKRDLQIKSLRNVPWVQTNATNIENYEPPEYDNQKLDNKEEQLEALGYK